MTDMNPFQQFIAKSRYARYLDGQYRREEWHETVARYFDFMENHLIQNYGYQMDRQRLEAAVLDLRVMPSMRALMTAGPALARDNVSGYNCSALPIDDIKAFDEAMHILLCGTGVGFSVENRFISKLPEVPDTLYESGTTIVVSDSKEGWAKALRQLIALLYAGEVPKWDLSKIRPAGSRLKTFGGRASGPSPLNDLFAFVVSKFKGATGRRLTSLECHDILCKIGEVVVVGGVRRAATLSLSDLEDDRMRRAKSGSWWETQPQRSLANNSAVYESKPDIGQFMREWLALYDSKSGERGIFNRESAKDKVKSNGRRNDNFDFLLNPCSFPGYMRILTENGYKSFESLDGQQVNLVNHNGSITPGSVWQSGYKPLIEIRFEGTSGRDSIVCTDDHVFMLNDGTECKASALAKKRLMPYVEQRTAWDKREFLAGFCLGDGALNRLSSETHRSMEVFIGYKDYDIKAMYQDEIQSETFRDKAWYSKLAYETCKAFNLKPGYTWERELPNQDVSDDFMAGLYSANGSVIKGSRVAFKTTSRALAEQMIDWLLAKHDIHGYITTNKPTNVTFSNGDYLCKESYDVNICQLESVIRFAERIGFAQVYKQQSLRETIAKKAPYVRCIRQLGVAPVYDFTEPETNWGVVEGVVVHNSEIILRPNQFCNLTEAVIRSTDTKDDLLDKVEIATILGTFQSTLTKFPYLRKVWQRNTEEERLLGVSLTGILDHPLMGSVSDETASFLSELKQLAVNVNADLASALGINQSTAITCVKPSGSVSSLVDSASGIHARHAQHYIRRVRNDIKDPITQFMIEAGVPHEPCVLRPESTMIFSFPMKAPDGAKTRDDMNAIEHLELWLQYQRHWCEHKPSVTITVKEHEWLNVGAWVYDHFDEVSGISFLPYDNTSYRQMPFETCSQQEYEALLAQMPESIDWNLLVEYDDNVQGVQTLACTGGVCEI